MREFRLYHGNTEKVVNEIVKSNQLLDKYRSEGDSHYLGNGFYFYDDPVQAMVWAKMKVKNRYKDQRWAVLECVINVEEEGILDLDKRDEQDFFFSEMKRLDEEIKEKDLEIIDYNDSYLCNHLANMLELSLITKTFVYKDMFNTFPPLFSNRKSKPYLITRHFRTEKQYVIKNTNIVVSLKKYNFNL